MPILGVGGGDFQVPIGGAGDDCGAHLHQVLLLLEPVGVGGQADAVPSPRQLHTTSAQPPAGRRPPSHPSAACQPQPRSPPAPLPACGMASWGPHPPGSCCSSQHPQNPAARRPLVCDVPFTAWYSGSFLPLRPKPREGVTRPSGSKMPFIPIQGHGRALGPARLIPAWSPGPLAQCNQRGAASLGDGLCWDHPVRMCHAMPYPCRTCLHPHHPSGLAVSPRAPPGAPPRSRQRGPCAGSVTPQGYGAGSPACGWARAVLCQVLPIGGKEGECKPPEHASTQGLGGQKGAWDPPAQQPLDFWDPGLGCTGSALQGGGRFIAPLCCP